VNFFVNGAEAFKINVGVTLGGAEGIGACDLWSRNSYL